MSSVSPTTMALGSMKSSVVVSMVSAPCSALGAQRLARRRRESTRIDAAVKRPSSVDQPSEDDEEEMTLQPPESPLDELLAAPEPESGWTVGLLGDGMVPMPESALPV